MIAIPFKAHLQFVTPARENGDRPLGVLKRSEDQRARDYPGTAGKRFVFHAALICADGDFFGTAVLDKVQKTFCDNESPRLRDVHPHHRGSALESLHAARRC